MPFFGLCCYFLSCFNFRSSVTIFQGLSAFSLPTLGHYQPLPCFVTFLCHFCLPCHISVMEPNLRNQHRIQKRLHLIGRGVLGQTWCSRHWTRGEVHVCVGMRRSTTLALICQQAHSDRGGGNFTRCSVGFQTSNLN